MNMMTQAFDKTAALYRTGTQGQAGLGTVMKGVTAVAKTNQTAGIEWADFARQSLAEGTATMKKLAAARTPQAALEIQTAYLKSSYERLVAQAQTMRELYTGLAGTMKPQGTGAKLPATV
ncbi:phasin family protein [Methylobacterium sp. J-090]|uniref:phasin family protein n=1 Tax=Methylobacterium sp. J-090 TaxID=2836666 RepID=UPI001FB9DCB6|nr:phasin family protein [Methylobacterium sp. J-090]MCJ2080797.1 phasin family protein [Methylobacterium sp. J-090]